MVLQGPVTVWAVAGHGAYWDAQEAASGANHREVARCYVPLTGRDEPDCQMQL